jgi:peptidoglycan/LPS O-acetylase OafA/YrhL
MRIPDHDSPAGLLPNRGAEVTRVAATVARVRHATLPYRPDIDGLRAVAVAVVVAYHAFPKFVTGGFAGVDVFFVISGYLITQLVLAGLQAGRFSLSGFYRRRVRRIVPALLVVLAACCLFGWFALLPGEWRWLGQSMSWCAPFLANVYFAGTGSGYFDRATELNPLLHLWSLGVEEQFYLVWPVLLMIAVRYGATLRVLVAVVATSLVISIWGGWYAPTPHFYLPASRVWELALGGMLAVWRPDTLRTAAANASVSRRLQRFGANASSLAGLALIGTAVFFASSEPGLAATWTVIATAGAALLIGAGPLAPANRWLLSCQPMVFVGRISYPLYLWHWPVFSFARIILGRAPSPGLAVAGIGIAFVAAFATYRLVEAPIRYGELGRKAVPVLLAGLAGFTLLGAAASARWISGRLSGPLMVAWDEAAQDWNYPGESNLGRRSGFGTWTVVSHRDRKVLFVGDSHIQQYWPRVAYVIDQHPDSARSAVFATRAGCPPLPGLDSLRPRRNCDGLFDHALERAFQGDIDTVVFGAFWEEYLLGEYAVDRSPRPISNVRVRSRGPLRLDSPGVLIAFEQFQQAISQLVMSGHRVFIVLSNPTSPLFDPDCLFPPSIRLSLRPPASFVLDSGRPIDAGPFESFVAPLMNRLREIARQTGAHVVDPRASLCDGMACPAVGADGLPLYLDSNHLRTLAARERATFVDEMLLGGATQ